MNVVTARIQSSSQDRPEDVLRPPPRLKQRRLVKFGIDRFQIQYSDRTTSRHLVALMSTIKSAEGCEHVGRILFRYIDMDDHIL